MFTDVWKKKSDKPKKDGVYMIKGKTMCGSTTYGFSYFNYFCFDEPTACTGPNEGPVTVEEWLDKGGTVESK